MYNAHMSDLSSSHNANSFQDLLLPGPPAFLAASFEPQEMHQLVAYLFALFRQPPDLRPLTPVHWHQSVAQCLGMASHETFPQEGVPQQAPETLPRVLLVAGRRLSDLFRVVEFWVASQLPRPIFAAATDNNLHFSIGQLIMHLEEEQRRMMQGENPEDHSNKS